MQHTALAEVCRTGEIAQYSSQLIAANRPKLMQIYTKHLCKYTQSNNANICIELGIYFQQGWIWGFQIGRRLEKLVLSKEGSDMVEVSSDFAFSADNACR